MLILRNSKTADQNFENLQEFIDYREKHGERCYNTTLGEYVNSCGYVNVAEFMKDDDAGYSRDREDFSDFFGENINDAQEISVYSTACEEILRLKELKNSGDISDWHLRRLDEITGLRHFLFRKD